MRQRHRPAVRSLTLAVFAIGTAIAMATAAVAVVAGQGKVRDVRTFGEVMRQAGEDWTIVAEMTPAPIFQLNGARADGLGRVEHMQGDFEAVRAFLVARGQAEAAADVAELLDALAFMRATLARATPDQAEAEVASAGVTEACATCHARYREGDAAAGYRARAGLLD